MALEAFPAGTFHRRARGLFDNIASHARLFFWSQDQLGRLPIGCLVSFARDIDGRRH